MALSSTGQVHFKILFSYCIDTRHGNHIFYMHDSRVNAPYSGITQLSMVHKEVIRQDQPIVYGSQTERIIQDQPIVYGSHTEN